MSGNSAQVRTSSKKQSNVQQGILNNTRAGFDVAHMTVSSDLHGRAPRRTRIRRCFIRCTRENAAGLNIDSVVHVAASGRETGVEPRPKAHPPETVFGSFATLQAHGQQVVMRSADTPRENLRGCCIDLTPTPRAALLRKERACAPAAHGSPRCVVWRK